ncbi:hypothetical protein [Carboxylicivirga sp. N1Y90]|uniref:hypothetical protein n=1 Tax=Carboxylicivirga fragile TaxID=3417571 RepID=UPI003D348EBB|nr:hypothetical protein [Marinilabiliaceae bacterium N1Y90]
MKKEYQTYQNRLKQIGAILIVAFAIQLVNNALFFHSHLSESGKAYSHAHPKSNANHTHSDFDYNFYAQLQLLSSQDLGQLLKDCIYFQIKKSSEQVSSNFQEITINISDGRAPPVFVIA